MSHDSITQAMVIAWDTAVQATAQQTVSRLMSTVIDKGTIEGESFTHNWMGDTELDANTDRLGDTVWGAIEHKTPIASMADFFKALPLDRFDIPKLKINPVTGGDYMASLMAAKNRNYDALIFNTLIGTQPFKDGTTEVLPAGQKILSSATGFTKAKIIQAKKLFRANECDAHAGETLYMLYNDSMLEDILADTTLTSADHMAVKMLQEGDVSGSWMGFKWVPYNVLSVSGSTATTAAYCKSAVKFGTGFIEGDITRRADKKNAHQVSLALSRGALRTEYKRVVSIAFEQ